MEYGAHGAVVTLVSFNSGLVKIMKKNWHFRVRARNFVTWLFHSWEITFLRNYKVIKSNFQYFWIKIRPKKKALALKGLIAVCENSCAGFIYKHTVWKQMTTIKYLIRDPTTDITRPNSTNNNAKKVTLEEWVFVESAFNINVYSKTHSSILLFQQFSRLALNVPGTITWTVEFGFHTTPFGSNSLSRLKSL